MKNRRRGVEIVVLALVFAAACGGTPQPPAPGPLRIVITNDDGIEAPGIRALAEAFRPLGQVTVAAPSGNRSGVSHGVTSDRVIAVRESERGGQKWFAIDALPATCVRLAVEELLPSKPDLVVSGINRGENLGTVTFYSATVAAAREAAFLGVPAMAINLASVGDAGYEAAASVTAAIARALGRNGIPRGTFLNVNVPALPTDRLRGIRITRQDTRAPVDFFEKWTVPDGSMEYRPRWEHLEPGAADTDIWAVRNGYVSVSIFGFDQSAAVPPAVGIGFKRLESLRLSGPD
jgi:5'-nucleotidase